MSYRKTVLILLLAISVFFSSCLIEPKRHEHDFTGGEVVSHVEPTCLVDGFESVRCKYCEAEEITVLPSPRQHVADKGTISRVAGHDITTYKCSVCGEFLENVVEHRLSDTWTTNDYYHWHDYECGCTGTEDNSPHVWQEQTSYYGTGCERVRLITKTCLVCGHVVTQAFVDYSHVPGTPQQEGTVLVTRCTICDKVLEVE